jgi:prepilin-type N-terminal cleavage/methylation domain-containing protein
MTRLRIRSRQSGDESGFTLIELLVAMGIFSVLLGVFATSMASFSKSTVRTYRISDQSTQARTVFDLFDKQVRAASAITVPGQITASGNWYVEFLNDTTLPSTCIQWVLRMGTDTLAVRNWTAGATAAATATPWRILVTDVVNTTTATDLAQQPFVLTLSTTDIPRQQLAVSLRFQQRNAPMIYSNSSFVARNTSTSTVTNVSGSGTAVCNFTGWRP